MQRNAIGVRSRSRIVYTAGAVAAVVTVLAAGCTTAVPVPPAAPGATAPSSPASGTPGPATSVHVKLVVKSDVATTVHYSDGQTTQRVEARGGEDAFEFDAPVPWVIAGTATANISAMATCQLYVDGVLVTDKDPQQSTMAVCAAAQQAPWPTAEGDDGAPAVLVGGAGSGTSWYGWVINDWVGSRVGKSLGVGGNQPSGQARVIAVPQKGSGTATCRIQAGKASPTTSETHEPGDIATCAATWG